jgi:hypothetical protein
MTLGRLQASELFLTRPCARDIPSREARGFTSIFDPKGRKDDGMNEINHSARYRCCPSFDLRGWGVAAIRAIALSKR